MAGFAGAHGSAGDLSHSLQLIRQKINQPVGRATRQDCLDAVCLVWVQVDLNHRSRVAHSRRTSANARPGRVHLRRNVNNSNNLIGLEFWHDARIGRTCVYTVCSTTRFCVLSHRVTWGSSTTSLCRAVGSAATQVGAVGVEHSRPAVYSPPPTNLNQPADDAEHAADDADGVHIAWCRGGRWDERATHPRGMTRAVHKPRPRPFENRRGAFARLGKAPSMPRGAGVRRALSRGGLTAPASGPGSPRR